MKPKKDVQPEEKISGTHSVLPSSVRHKIFGRVTMGWGAGEFYHLTVKGGMIDRTEARELMLDLQEFLKS